MTIEVIVKERYGPGWYCCWTEEKHVHAMSEGTLEERVHGGQRQVKGYINLAGVPEARYMGTFELEALIPELSGTAVLIKQTSPPDIWAFQAVGEVLDRCEDTLRQPLKIASGHVI